MVNKIITYNVFLQLVLLNTLCSTFAQECKITSKAGKYFLQTKEGSSTAYDTILFVPIVKNNSKASPHKGIYLAVLNWKKTYFNKHTANYYSEKNHVPLFSEAEFDVYTATGKKINTNGPTSPVLLPLVNYYMEYYKTSDSLRVNEWLPANTQDSLRHDSFLLLGNSGKYFISDYSGKLYNNAPVNFIEKKQFHQYETITLGTKYGYFNNTGNYYPPIYDFIKAVNTSLSINKIERKKVVKNSIKKNDPKRYIETMDEDIMTYSINDFESGVIDGVYLPSKCLFLLVKNAKLKDTVVNVDTLIFKPIISKDSNEDVGTEPIPTSLPVKAKHFVKGEITLLDANFNQITGKEFEDVYYASFVYHPVYFFQLLSLTGLKENYHTFRQGESQAYFPVHKGKIGMINRAFKEVVDYEYEKIYLHHTFEQNYASMKKNNKFSVFDLEGNKITKQEYDSIWFYTRPDSGYYAQERIPCFNEFAFIKSGKKTGVISLKDGGTIIPAEYDYIWMDADANVFVINKGAKMKPVKIDTIYEKRFNNEIFDLKYGAHFHGKKVPLPQGGKFGIISNDGKIIEPVEHAMVIPGTTQNITHKKYKFKPNSKVIINSPGCFFNPNNDFLTYKNIMLNKIESDKK